MTRDGHEGDEQQDGHHGRQERPDGPADPIQGLLGDGGGDEERGARGRRGQAMDRFTTMMTPKNTGSMPSCLTRGSSTGAKMMMEGTVSITVPTSSSKRH